MFDTGDIVHHLPSGEEWLVAFVQNGMMHWCGWPPGNAEEEEFRLVCSATPEMKQRLMEDKRTLYARAWLRRN